MSDLALGKPENVSSTRTKVAGNQSGYSRAVHGLAVVLTIAVFPLIWVGGLVTTYDAGMAVPDWPGTYGENMFAYQAWLFGPFDLMVEHGHRLLGTVAGFLSIGLVIACFRWEPRKWFRLWSVFVLLAVIAQGALGGARVLLDERTFAMIHGCTGPLFFAIATATAVMSSRWWLGWKQPSPSIQAGISRAGSEQEPSKTSKKTAVTSANANGVRDSATVGQYATGRVIVWLATAAVLLSYIQLIMGAQLRHVTGLMTHKVFKGFVHMHLGLAGLVAIVVFSLAIVALVGRRTPVKVRRITQLLSLLVLAQLALGIGTWVVNYALPWPEMNEALAGYTIQAKGYWESLIVTAHMATGSLIISLATVAALRAWRSREHGNPGGVFGFSRSSP